MRSTFLLVLVATSAFADPPRLEVRASKWQSGKFSVDVSVRGPSSGERLGIGGPGRAWQQAIAIKVIDGDGAEQKWPFTPRDSKSAAQAIVISETVGGGRSFELTKAQVAKLKPGAYEIVATLDLRDAGSGWDGVVSSSTSVTMGTPKVEVAAAPADALAELKRVLPKIGTRNGLMQVEALLQTAPELEPGPALDAVVLDHLAKMAAHMNKGLGYASKRDYDSYQPKNELVFGLEARLTPSRVSAGFTTKMGSAKVTRASDLEAFWKWIHENNGHGLHVLSVRTLGDVVRVATIGIEAGGPAERRVEISFWKRDGSKWSLLSYQPWPNEARDLWSNVYPGGEAKRKASELTLVERRQYLELRLGIVEISMGDYRESGRGEATLSRGFGAGHLDEAYVPLLEEAQRSTNPHVRGAVIAELIELGKAPSDDVALELLAVETLGSEAREKLLGLLEKKLSGGRAATAVELAAIIGPEDGRGDKSARIIDDSLAVVTEDNLSRGQKTLFRKVDGAWKRVTVILSWIH